MKNCHKILGVTIFAGFIMASNAFAEKINTKKAPAKEEPKATQSAGEIINFDKDLAGTLPSNWIAGSTGGGKPKWSVEDEATAPSMPHVLKQFGTGKYPWCVKKDVSLVDGYVEVQFKPISGKEDQAGGVIWRWQDGDNYYIARANALENNVTIYHTIKGVRKSFQKKDIKVATNQWHTLRVDFKGSHFIVNFDGKKVIEAEDNSIQAPGAVGVWTKADSHTLFDNFSYGKK